MKISEVYPELIVVKKWFVKSKTSKRLWLVTKMADGSFRCKCPAYKECWHIKEIKKIFENEK